MLRIHRRHLRDSTDPFHLPEARFVELFRFNKEVTLRLLEEICPFMRIGVKNTYIPKHIRLTAALHFYATGSFLRDIGQDFVCPMSKSTLCLVIKEVTFIIQDKLMQKYIRFPTSADEQNTVKQR
ncbi:uncharacterized protein LOC119664499 [Teleopsis dalmanni]|nr:uncharacterized protein LOC119664499 [Teleopsis dalmanni]